jgi:hypothetical protein
VPGPDIGFRKSMQVSANTTVTKFRFVTQTASQVVKQADTAAQRAYGVSYNDVSAAESAMGNSGGKTVEVIIEGQPLVEANTAIVVDALVTTDSVGRAITATTGQQVLGIARKAAAATGDLIPVQLTAGARTAP